MTTTLQTPQDALCAAAPPTQRGQPQREAARTMMAQRALAVALSVTRNPGMTTIELQDAFELGRRALQRVTATARRAGIILEGEGNGHPESHRWFRKPDIVPHPDANTTLLRWLDAMEKGGVDLTDMPEMDRIQWYRDVGKLMLVGTPPFYPHDHIDVVVTGKRLTIVVPRGRSVTYGGVNQ